MATVTDRDRALARGLPDEFLSWPGIPLDGLLHAVDDYWGQFEIRARCELVGRLLTALAALLEDRTKVMAADRDACEAVVTSWLERQ